MFLTADEIATLTGLFPTSDGRRQHKRQIAWLKKKGYRFEVNRMGHPVVPRSAVEARIGRQKTVEPNWEAMR